MNFIEQKLTESKKYTRYQVQKIMYVIKTLSADISKLIILGILFHNHFLSYIVALTTLFLLRSFSGGIHNNTYIGCFMTSFIYLLLSIIYLPPIAVSFPIKILLLTACMVICEWIGPVISKHRPPLSQAKISVCKSITTTVIFLIVLIVNIIPSSHYAAISFWVVILHALQLIIAKLIVVARQKKTKGGSTEC